MTKQNKILTSILITAVLAFGAFSFVSAANTGSITSTATGTQTQIQKSWGKAFSFGMQGGKNSLFDTLTDAEKTALEAMSDQEKQAFFDKKRIEKEAKIEARENVIDKKLSDQALTESEKVLLNEIIKERAEMKTRRNEMKAAFEAIKPLLDKKRAGTSLTSEEQTQLDAFEAKYPHPGKGGKGGKKGKKKGFGDHF